VWEKRRREAEKLFEKKPFTSTQQNAPEQLAECSGDAQDTNNVAQDSGGRQDAFPPPIFLGNRSRTLTRLSAREVLTGRD